jgi:hypothetical protein
MAKWSAVTKITNTSWTGVSQDLTDPLFSVTFDDPDNPLTVDEGGPLTMVRATTANYLHPTTDVLTEAAVNILRIETNGALIEEQRTNSILQSRQFDTTWTNVGTVLTKDQVGIDGVANSAWTMEDNNVAAQEGILQAVTVVDDSNTHCTSIFIGKDNDETRFPEIRLAVSGGTAQNIFVQINTKTGALVIRVKTGTAAAQVIDYNSSFWRVELCVTNNSTGNVTATTTVFPAFASTLGGSDVATVGSIVIDGAQTELNSSVASSFIPTTTTAVTRNADDLSITTSGNMDETVGTLYMEYDQPQITARVDKLTDGTNAMFNSTTSADIFTDQTNTLTYTDSNIVANTTRKVAMSWEGATLRFVADGGTLESTTFDGNLSLGTTLDIGSTGGTNSINGHIGVIKIWGVALPNTELVSMTA